MVLPLLLLAAGLVAAADAKGWTRQMTVQVGAGKEECFYIPSVKNGDHISGEFQVTDTSTSTGNMDIEARLMGPGADGMVLYDSSNDAQDREDVSFDTFELDIDEEHGEGDFRFCLNNYMSSWSEKTVWFEINFKAGREPEDPEIDDYDYYGDDYIDEEEMKAMKERNEDDATLFEMTAAEIKSTIHKVRISVGKVRHFQLMFGASMSSDSHQVTNNFEKINMWSTIHLTLILAVGLIQVYMIRQLFEDKSIFHRFTKKP